MFKKTMLVATLFAVSFSTASAMDFEDAVVGETAYIDTWIDDEKVTIVAVDSSDNTIKVKRSNDETAWKNPDELMTPLMKKGEDFVEDQLLDIGGNILKGLFSNNN